MWPVIGKNFKTRLMEIRTLLLICFILFSVNLVHAQSQTTKDTVRINLTQFIKRGLEHSDEIKAERMKVKLAENTVGEVKSKRILPKFDLTTGHSFVPGVRSDSTLANGKPFPKDQYYLDPNLKNDWSRFSVYSQVKVEGIQPLFTWGAMNNALRAARKGAEAAADQFEAKKSDYALRLYQLYYSRVLAMEMERLLGDAQKEFDKADKKIKQMQKEKDSNLSDSDVYKFKIYKAQFDIKADEVKENTNYIDNIWNLALGGDTSKVYLPESPFLNPVENKIKPFSYYQSMAIARRPELRGIKAAESAARFGLKAKKAQLLPTLFLGLGGEYVYTPRPTERTPMIGNRFSYANLYYAFGIRQNLNFWSVKNDIEKTKIQFSQIKYSKDAIVQGITLQINNRYKTAKIAENTYEKTGDALQTSKEWLRQEQINYDLGIGEMKNLLDAVKTNLQLEADYRQKIYNYNLDMAKLYEASGISLSQLQQN